VAKVKSKTKDEVVSIFKFQYTSKPGLMAKQRALVEMLKQDFTYTYWVRTCHLFSTLFTNITVENQLSKEWLYEKPCNSRNY
jgi:hypothetical protein